MYNYTIINGNTINELIIDVNEMIKKGYTPLGGFVHIGSAFFQSMVQLDEKNET